MKKLRIVTALLASLLSSAAVAADTDAGYADISFTIPLVALIDVSNPGTTVTFQAPTNAGQGFSGNVSLTNEETSLAVSSNMLNSKLYAKTDIAIPNGMWLKIKTSNIPNQSTQNILLAGDGTTDTLLNNIGLVSTPNGRLTLDAGATVAGGSMIPHGMTNLKVIYTLTEN